jgi:hypothetical protein
VDLQSDLRGTNGMDNVLSSCDEGESEVEVDSGGGVGCDVKTELSIEGINAKMTS